MAVTDVQTLERRVEELEAALAAATEHRVSFRLERDRLDELARLPNDWDSYGGEPPTAIAISMAHDLLAGVAERFGIADAPRLLPWAISPLSDGGVQVEWRTADVAIEVEINPAGEMGYLIEREGWPIGQPGEPPVELPAVLDELGRLLGRG